MFILFNVNCTAKNWRVVIVDVFCCVKVSALESPLGVLPMAVLRSPDIISFTVSLPEDKSTDASWFVASSENDCCCVIHMLRHMSQFCIPLHCTFQSTACRDWLHTFICINGFNAHVFNVISFNTVSWCIPVHQEFNSLQLLCYMLLVPVNVKPILPFAHTGDSSYFKLGNFCTFDTSSELKIYTGLLVTNILSVCFALVVTVLVLWKALQIHLLSMCILKSGKFRNSSWVFVWLQSSVFVNTKLTK